jgi:nicotinamidase-related amidase
MVKALLVVDMVRGFVDERTKDGPCALYVKGARSLIPNINREIRSLKKGDKLVFVCDRHVPNDKEFRRWPKHCIITTEETKVAVGFEAVHPSISMTILPKTRFSAFFKTYLDELLEDVDEVIVTGVVTEFCVMATALDAAYRDFKVIIPKDCVCPLDPDDGERALKWLSSSLGVEVR